MNFSKRLNLFGDEIFAALNNERIRLELEKQGKKIYNMSVGTPDFHTPDHIKKALMEAAADDSELALQSPRSAGTSGCGLCILSRSASM